MRVISLLCALIALSVLTSFSAFGQAPDLEKLDVVMRSVPDGPVAKVNTTYIAAKDFTDIYQREIEMVQQRNNGQSAPDDVRISLGIRCLRVLMDTEIMYQEAKRRGIKVSESEVEDAWENNKKLLMARMTGKQDQPETETEILSRLGATKKEVLSRIERLLLVDKTSGLVAKEMGVSVTDEEVKEFFDKNKDAIALPDRFHLRHIFVKKPKGSDAAQARARREAKTRAENVLKRVMAGETFEGVAKGVSDAPDAQSGGDMGIVSVLSLPPFLVESAYKLSQDEISDVIESDLGFHIIKLVEKLPGENRDFDTEKGRIRALLLAEREAKVLGKFCAEKLDNDANVSIYLELERNAPDYARSN